MFKVSLTGNYFSGQFEAAQLFEEFGVPVFDANLLTKFFLNFSEFHISKIKSHFGVDIYSYGLLNLNKFKTNQDFDQLLNIIETDLMKAYESFRLTHQKSFYTIFLYDYIFERGMNKMFDYNIVSFKSKENRRSQLSYWKHFDYDTITNILNNEMSDYRKNSHSDYIIRSSNSQENINSDIVIGLENQIKDIHKKIMNKRTNKIIRDQYLSDDWY